MVSKSLNYSVFISCLFKASTDPGISSFSIWSVPLRSTRIVLILCSIKRVLCRCRFIPLWMKVLYICTYGRLCGLKKVTEIIYSYNLFRGCIRCNCLGYLVSMCPVPVVYFSPLTSRIQPVVFLLHSPEK